METTGFEPVPGRCKAARAAVEHYVPNFRAEVGYAASALFFFHENNYEAMFPAVNVLFANIDDLYGASIRFIGE